MGAQKCEQIFTTAREVGLLEAITPVCNQAYRTIVHPVLRGEVLASLRMERSNYEALSLIDAVSCDVEEEESDIEMEDLDDPQAFQPIQQDDPNPNIKEEEF